MAEKGPSHSTCKICGEILPRPEGDSSFVACSRCGTTNRVRKADTLQITLAFAITALILYIPANFFPFMSLEMYGNRNTSTIWQGIVSLVDAGSWGIAIIIFLASILIPFVKLVILFYLGFTAQNGQNRRLKTKLYLIVEAIGRWSMLDIFLLAVLVAVMKMGHWAHAEPEIGSGVFALVVIFTMLSSAYFDPKVLWEHDDEQH
ncbi:paraquat-inducible protein A [Bdellovibrio bacteriovorus]|uniref:paraquat-inducible protein A n=1 Tax=Bdellovibrio TaxID=958 RepID=UPI0035A8E970